LNESTTVYISRSEQRIRRVVYGGNTDATEI